MHMHCETAKGAKGESATTCRANTSGYNCLQTPRQYRHTAYAAESRDNTDITVKRQALAEQVLDHLAHAPRSSSSSSLLEAPDSDVEIDSSVLGALSDVSSASDSRPPLVAV